MQESGLIRLSDLDEMRFGIRVAKANDVSAASLDKVLASCRAEDVRLLITRSPVADLGTVHALERQGFLLMDTLVYYSFSYEKLAIPDDRGKTQIRSMKEGEAEIIREVAARSFKGYLGHYHADDRLDDAQCDDVYVDWAYRSASSKDYADDVLVAVADGAILGFATLRMNSPEEGEGVLFGVAPEAQGKGVYRSFMVNGLKWGNQRGAKRMVVSTQVTNGAVQRVWARLGFEYSRGYYTFHRWFD